MNDISVVSLKCPHCGANLSIGKTVDMFACGYCGASVKVERSGNIIALTLLTDAMSSVQRGTDRTAAELAIRRLSEELLILEREQNAILDSRRPKRGTLILCLIVGIAAGVVALELFGTVLALNKAAIFIIAAVAASVCIWILVRRGERRNRATQENDVQRRIQIATTRLKEQRLIVDS